MLLSSILILHSVERTVNCSEIPITDSFSNQSGDLCRIRFPKTTGREVARVREIFHGEIQCPGSWGKLVGWEFCSHRHMLLIPIRPFGSHVVLGPGESSDRPVAGAIYKLGA